MGHAGNAALQIYALMTSAAPQIILVAALSNVSCMLFSKAGRKQTIHYEILCLKLSCVCVSSPPTDCGAGCLSGSCLAGGECTATTLCPNDECCSLNGYCGGTSDCKFYVAHGTLED